MTIVKSSAGISPTGFKLWQLWLVVLTGTAVRLCWGCFAHPWLHAPDQLAWQLGLDEMQQNGNWSYLQLGHAPHEGGSVLIGFSSLLFSPLQFTMPALSCTALLIDTLIRWLQIKIAQRLFGSATAIWFGVWTIFSMPLLLSWSVVNFGLHYFASVFPFAFFWLVMRYQHHRYLPQLLGVCCAVAVSFAYENLLLVIPAIWSLFHREKKYSALLKFLLVLCVCLLPHILLRVFVDTGYPFLQGGFFGRETKGFFHPQSLLTVWFTAMPASFLLGSPFFVPDWIKLVLVLLFICVGLVRYLVYTRSALEKACLGFVLMFLLVYAASPFSTKAWHDSSFTVYRHLAYIVPLLVLLMMHGFVHAGNWKNYWLIGWLAFCGLASFAFANRKYEDGLTAYRAAGWILVQKYGTDIPRLFRMQQMADTMYHQKLAMGIGWGLAASLLRQEGDSNSVSRLRFLILQAPQQFQSDMVSGIRYAFAPGITPVLPFSQWQKFDAGR